MKCLITIFCLSIALAAIPLAAQDHHKDAKGKGDHPNKLEPALTPELAAWKREVESWPSEKVRQTIVVEKKSLEDWARKNNFNPPGDEYDGDKNKLARKGRLGMRVVIGKRQQAELMAQFLPRKARIDVMEQVLRERENPRKKPATKRDK
jgi:hypothetical protein